MGQQLNKIQKRRRRQDYLERLKVKAKKSPAAAKPKIRKVPAKKKDAPSTPLVPTAAGE
jgi:hypothetical protein